jgi:hypothetical protein
MYNVRNSFVHGNPVTWNDLTHSAGAGKINVYEMAAPVYRTALVSYLAKVVALGPSKQEREEVEIGELLTRADYAEALDISLGHIVPVYRQGERL